MAEMDPGGELMPTSWFLRIRSIFSIVFQLLSKGHDLGLFDKDGNPISNVQGLVSHIEKRRA